MRRARLIALFVGLLMVAGCATSPPPAEPTASDAPRVVLVFFEPDSAVIEPAARTALSRILPVLTAEPALRVVIEGHTDQIGTPDYNLALGVRRAAAVQAFLTDAGVALARISSLSYGLESPGILSAEPRASALLRRVVVRAE
jgi:peptidoglycan-associated lipoprotein